MSKLSREYLESLIDDTQYQQVGSTSTVCVLTLRSGFVVVGHSACLNAADFDAETGRAIARENAVSKLWDLEGYHVKATQYAEQMLSGG